MSHQGVCPGLFCSYIEVVIVHPREKPVDVPNNGDEKTANGFAIARHFRYYKRDLIDSEGLVIDNLVTARKNPQEGRTLAHS